MIKLIGILGDAQNGKTTIANYLKHTRNAYVVNFSRIIKGNLQSLYGLTEDQLYGSKKEVVIEGGPLAGWTPRAMMQDYGDALKRYNKSIFTEDGQRQINEIRKDDKDRLIVIEDVRFTTTTEEQEILGKKYTKTLRGEDELILSNGGILVRVVKNGYISKTDEAGIPGHNSELQQRGMKAHHTLEAGIGELQKLYDGIDNILDAQK